MGVGMDGQANYSEDDVKECARAFTGWTITNAIPRYPYWTVPLPIRFQFGRPRRRGKDLYGRDGELRR